MAAAAIKTGSEKEHRHGMQEDSIILAVMTASACFGCAGLPLSQDFLESQGVKGLAHPGKRECSIARCRLPGSYD
jgi:hypothetical protein